MSNPSGASKNSLVYTLAFLFIIILTIPNKIHGADGTNLNLYSAANVQHVILEPSDGNIYGNSFHVLTIIPNIFTIPPILLCFTRPNCWDLEFRSRQMSPFLKMYIDTNQRSPNHSNPLAWPSIYVDCSKTGLEETGNIHRIFTTRINNQYSNFITFDQFMLRHCKPLRNLLSNRVHVRVLSTMWNGIGSIYDAPTNDTLLFFNSVYHYTTQYHVNVEKLPYINNDNQWNFYIGGSPSLDRLLMKRFNRFTSINVFAITNQLPEKFLFAISVINGWKAALKKVVYISDLASEIYGLPAQFTEQEHLSSCCENHHAYVTTLLSIIDHMNMIKDGNNDIVFIVQTSDNCVTPVISIDYTYMIIPHASYNIIDFVDLMVTSSIRTVAEIAALSKPTILIREDVSNFEIYPNESMLASVVCENINSNCFLMAVDDLLFRKQLIKHTTPTINNALEHYYGFLFIRNKLEFGTFRRLHWLLYHTSQFTLNWDLWKLERHSLNKENHNIFLTLNLRIPTPDDVIRVAMFQRTFVEIGIYDMKKISGKCKLEFNWVDISVPDPFYGYHGVLIDYGHLFRGNFSVSSLAPIVNRHRNQVWIELAIENAAMYPFLKHDKLRQFFHFDIQAHARVDSELPFMFQIWSYLHNNVNPQEMLRSRDPPYSIDQWMRRKNGVLIMYSNTDDSLGRLEYFEALSKYYPVYNYGSSSTEKLGVIRSNRTVGNILTDGVGEKNYLATKFKFIAAFENSAIDTYVSQQLFTGLIARTIPIFDGSYKTAQQYIPSPSSIIFKEDYSTPEELANYLWAISANPSQARQHLQWAIDPHDCNSKFEAFLNNSADSFPERLCHQIRERMRVKLTQG